MDGTQIRFRRDAERSALRNQAARAARNCRASFQSVLRIAQQGGALRPPRGRVAYNLASRRQAAIP